MSTDLDSFWQKAREVGVVLSATEDYKATEPVLQDLVAIVKSRPDLLLQFENAFIEMLEDPAQYSVLAVQYCMHVLRLPGVRQHALNRLERAPLRSDAHARYVVEAYSDAWPLAAIFKRSLRPLQ